MFSSMRGRPTYAHATAGLIEGLCRHLLVCARATPTPAAIRLLDSARGWLAATASLSGRLLSRIQTPEFCNSEF